jgi:hypothetical protein
MRYLSLCFGAVISTTILGCAVDSVGSGSDLGDAIEVTGKEQQEVWRSPWSPSEWATSTVGMSHYCPSSTCKIYAWYDDGWVCRGNVTIGSLPTHDVCSDAMYVYSAPDGNFAAIRGVGIAQNTSQVYAWYSDSTYTRGTSGNLTQYANKFAFSRPNKPGGGTFSMSELIEVDNSLNGQWYYYWKVGGTVYRTTGTSADGDEFSQAATVSVSSNHGSIVGIGFNVWFDCGSLPCVQNSPIVAWYSDGFFNQSTSSSNLNQP